MFKRIFCFLSCILFPSVLCTRFQEMHKAPTILKIGQYPAKKKERDPYRKKLRKLTSKAVRYMTEDELRAGTDLAVLLKDFDQALILLKQLIKITQSVTVAKIARLEIADITFEIGDLKNAAKHYEEYIELYPGDKEKVAYACYKGILSNFYSILPADRDQTATLKTIELANNFLVAKNAMFKTYNNEVERIKTTCLSRLWEHDVVIVNFHIKRGSIGSAKLCVADARAKLLPQIPGIEKHMLECDYTIALAEKDTTSALKIAQDLAKRFPESLVLTTAKKPTNFAIRF